MFVLVVMCVKVISTFTHCHDIFQHRRLFDRSNTQWHFLFRTDTVYLIKGTKWPVFGGKDSFYVILKRKYSFRRDSNPRSIGCGANDLPLSYLTCWWMSIKVAHIKYKIILCCLQINQAYAIVIKWLKCKMSWNFVTSGYNYWKSTKFIVSLIATFLCVCLGVVHAKNHLDRISGCL